jgi:Cof subfamily protein (haloacid dehalogenase superfamily)
VKEYRPALRPEPAFPIRLLALDIDGTLVGHDFRVSDRTRVAIGEAVRMGVRVSLATGRMASSAVVYANQLGLVEPIIAHQGAVVREMPSRRERVDPDALPWRGRVGRLRHHEALPAPVVREALAWCRANGLSPHVNVLERIVVWAGDPSFEDYSGYLGPEADIVPDLDAAIRRPMTKVISLGVPPRPMELIAEARRHFAGRADATVSHPRFLEFVAPGVSKGGAVAWLAHKAGLPLSQVMTIGDALNDIEMIEDAGHGAAMASAPPEVRLAARYIAPPVEEDGTAALIEALVLAPPREAARNAARLAEEARDIQRSLRGQAPAAPAAATS